MTLKTQAEQAYFEQFIGDYDDQWIVENYIHFTTRKFITEEDAVRYIKSNLMNHYGANTLIRYDKSNETSQWWVVLPTRIGTHEIDMLLYPI